MKTLLLAPHSDDAEIGCGGTIARFIEEGHDILWIVFVGRQNTLRDGEHVSAVEEIGLKKGNCTTLEYTMNRIHERNQDVLDYLFSIKTGFKPDLVIGPSVNDLHQDHETIGRAMMRAFKRNVSVISYELPWNSVAFESRVFVRLEERHVEKKIKMLESFKSQMFMRPEYFRVDFIRGQMAIRGLQAGSKYAEGFEVLRWMV